MTKTTSTFLTFIAVLVSPMAANAVPILVTTDFIDDGARTGFNGFEAIPNDGTFYTGGSGPYVEGGISVEQINGDPGNDIWINCGSCGIYEGNYSWYPNGGGSGYTEVTLADGSDFFDFGFYAGTGDGPSLIFFDLLLDGLSVLSGSTTAPIHGSSLYVGFGGGGYDTIRVRDNFGGGSNVYDGRTTLVLDALEVRTVPEPGTLALLGLGLVGMAARRRRKV